MNEPIKEDESCIDHIIDHTFKSRNLIMYMIMPVVFTIVHLAVLCKYGENFVQYYKNCIIFLNVIIILKCI